MQKALYIILVSLGLGLIFNFLFFEKLIGVSLIIFTLILLGAAALLSWQQLQFRKIWWIITLIGFFALMPSIRTNEFLTFLNVCATLGLLILLAHEVAGTPTLLMKLWDYILMMVLVPLGMLRSALSTINLASKIQSSDKQHEMWLRVFKGVLMAIPALIIFGALFSQADLAFSKFLRSIVDINISERTIQYLVLLAFSSVASLSFLSYVFTDKRDKVESLQTQSESAPAGRNIEIMVFLGLIATLFLVFIGFQVTYLFGGESNIVNAGFTYAEYARRGFFELLAVAILSLVVLLASEKYSHAESKKDKRFLITALILIVEVGVVIFSACKRLSLYIDAYGMTLLRFYVTGFIILLSVLFILLAIKFVKSKREQFFVFGMLLSIIGFLVTINLINPDTYIAKSNIDQFNRTGKIDVSYFRELSADATPLKIELYNKLTGEDKAVLQELLLKEKDKLRKTSTDWQSANFSRARALKILQGF
ncbi:MAG: hypothetical protein A3I07_02280 [Candidatus Doudnabacteria bacterium RIFCSPLOWO2_02_FULL_42_9]|uniref:Uncharacterized protein n=1 Tax=Candidatus Doudnabacteria bacterium RIFCSPHIGHO2_01_FULL_41_86 TaxID=1817821 RepID=A0A1F5N817_9BACT|nr:MAG: hypothetical protein A2717_04175 [Candidatus Doudnabacteria bacterium RIFCSPHIGHO2_01_FULL_41_86]OGE75302.1 MAG: hypothetical protein A3K07_00710 [Candidatus Doudnabacteria bacterium RIFCSPHIGHO2_01_43_10]OGE85828.1 MAG: hypothetical protein A3E28_03520 [Candidatus Doudnabacteria bacterium RIFCSPHIGHO2_12_FULL_42_22]OGE87322.1 MAG: hypothetical protein A3C49_01140 [Candidatus Doudnabacteria bacterium RIFCSPHIGHO2_02_FULL_42_25]OGE92160.1 MAG: hypothetical protein A2895_01015 [Candidatus